MKRHESKRHESKRHESKRHESPNAVVVDQSAHPRFNLYIQIRKAQPGYPQVVYLGGVVDSTAFLFLAPRPHADLVDLQKEGTRALQAAQQWFTGFRSAGAEGRLKDHGDSLPEGMLVALESDLGRLTMVRTPDVDSAPDWVRQGFVDHLRVSWPSWNAWCSPTVGGVH